MNRGNISAISTYLTQSGKRRIFLCNACEATFSETRDTVFFDLILMGLERAAHKAHEINTHLLSLLPRYNLTRCGVSSSVSAR